jgi:hypothetical protein
MRELLHDWFGWHKWEYLGIYVLAREERRRCRYCGIEQCRPVVSGEYARSAGQWTEAR